VVLEQACRFRPALCSALSICRFGASAGAAHPHARPGTTSTPPLSKRPPQRPKHHCPAPRRRGALSWGPPGRHRGSPISNSGLRARFRVGGSRSVRGAPATERKVSTPCPGPTGGVCARHSTRGLHIRRLTTDLWVWPMKACGWRDCSKSECGKASLYRGGRLVGTRAAARAATPQREGVIRAEGETTVRGSRGPPKCLKNNGVIHVVVEVSDGGKEGRKRRAHEGALSRPLESPRGRKRGMCETARRRTHITSGPTSDHLAEDGPYARGYVLMAGNS